MVSISKGFQGMACILDLGDSLLFLCTFPVMLIYFCHLAHGEMWVIKYYVY